MKTSTKVISLFIVFALLVANTQGVVAAVVSLDFSGSQSNSQIHSTISLESINIQDSERPHHAHHGSDDELISVSIAKPQQCDSNGTMHAECNSCTDCTNCFVAIPRIPAALNVSENRDFKQVNNRQLTEVYYDHLKPPQNS